MDNPTKNLIPRSAVEYICRKETVSTNPNDFTHSEKFIRYLNHDAISSFGRWQWANGFNTALVAVKCGLDKIPTIEPEQMKGHWIQHHEELNGSRGGVICSECGWKTHNKMHLIMGCSYRFCPNCGAWMEGTE